LGCFLTPPNPSSATCQLLNSFQVKLGATKDRLFGYPDYQKGNARPLRTSLAIIPQRAPAVWPSAWRLRPRQPLTPGPGGAHGGLPLLVRNLSAPAKDRSKQTLHRVQCRGSLKRCHGLRRLSQANFGLAQIVVGRPEVGLQLCRPLQVGNPSASRLS